MATFKYWKDENYIREYEDGKIEDLNQSLIKHEIKKNIHGKIMENGEQIKKTSKNEAKAEWFFNAMNVMDDLLDEETKKKVREDCACCLEGKRHKLCRTVNKDYKTPEERIQAINESHYIFGHEIKIIGLGKYEVAFFDEKMPEKRCSCLKVVMNKKMSKTYCYCCGKHVKHHLETVLNKKLQVEILASALSSMGKKSCRFILEELE
ncbi:MAG: hypothetical protein LBK66_09425 [Spirochaetaceae bacterium]|nr:hypothetical protein [Spirochaetaceae bacterium]